MTANMYRMSDTDPRHGEALGAFLDALRGTTSMRQFAIQHRFDHNWVSQWRNEDSPRPVRIEQMRAIADGLGLPLGEILVAAEFGTPDDFGGVRLPDPKLPDIDDAIKRDPTLTKSERRALKGVRDAIKGENAVDVRDTRK